MRRTVLLESVEKVLGHDVDVRDAAYVWKRHRWITYYSAGVFGAIALTAPVGGIEDWPTRIVLGLAGVSVAVMATTKYSVVAETNKGLQVLKASRIRQVAIEKEHLVEFEATFAPVGGNIIATDWQVGDRVFTVPRSSEQAMQRMASGRSSLG